MVGKREKPEETVSKLWQIEVLQGHGATIAEAVCQIGVTQQTFIGGESSMVVHRSQLTRLKELEKENQRLRRAVSDLTLGKLILSEAAKGDFRDLRVVESTSVSGQPERHENVTRQSIWSSGPFRVQFRT